MDSQDVKEFKRWFALYVAGYFHGDPFRDQPLKLKQEHTERTCLDILMLGKALGLTLHEMALAETMALFHDIGRFEQYAVYGTFKDAESEDHAKLGIKQLAAHDVLSVCSDDEESIITKAIEYHNQLTLPDDEDERVLFFARLLRDADKLDIWRVFIDYYKNKGGKQNPAVAWGLPDRPELSPKVMDALRGKKMAQTRDMATLSDYKLVQMSWVFDLNFKPTFRAVRERGYIEAIAAALPKTREVEEAVKIVTACLDEHVC